MCLMQFGQLGLGKHDDAPLPELVTGLAGHQIVQLACGWRHSLAVSAEGQVFAWGRAGNGQLGLGEARIPDQCATSLLPPFTPHLGPCPS